MIEILLKKKSFLVSFGIITFIFAFGFIGSTFIFTNPEQVFKEPLWDPEDDEYCSDPINRERDFSRCKQRIRRFEGPSLEHPLGLDDQGRDVLARLSWGTRHSLEIGIVASIIITGFAIFFGAVGAYVGGVVDDFMQFIVNIFIILPVVPVLLLISYFTKDPGFQFIIEGHILIAVIIAFVNWAWAARSIRSQVLSLKERNFVNMARVSGMNNISISLTEILPNMFSYIMLVFAMSLGISIGSEAALSVLGIGVDITFPTLGTLLYWARVLLSATTYNIMYHVFLPPGILITVLFVSIYIVQSEMDEVFNPRLRKG
ncbi:MAG: ABC transporter permease [Candidatus Thorarchaeota archaeon]